MSQVQHARVRHIPGLRSLPKRPSLPPEGAYALANAARVAANLAHSTRPMPDYLCINLSGAYPDLAPERSFLQQQFLPPVTSIAELEQRFQRIAADPRIRGIVLKLSPLALSMAQLESLRQAIESLRSTGKRVFAWSTGYSTAGYFLASAADEILLQPACTTARPWSHCGRRSASARRWASEPRRASPTRSRVCGFWRGPGRSAFARF